MATTQISDIDSLHSLFKEVYGAQIKELLYDSILLKKLYPKKIHKSIIAKRRRKHKLNLP